MPPAVGPLCGSAVGLLVCLLIGIAPGRAAEVDFATEVLPLLSDRCSICHGPDEGAREADLRVDVPAVLDAESQNGGLERVIAPGDAEQSELIRRITSTDPGERMPPPESNLSLTSEEIDVLRRWIDQGAEWDQHWSFSPIVKPSLPIPPAAADAGSLQIRNPIDAFVEARLREEGISATAVADRHTLVRRLTLDLTGLPPSPEEIERFVADPAPDAYERLVDRLLASPAYGQRMAIPWLDASRYADTYGYQSDVYREVWPWRDWVVDAIGQNMPYDQFLTWQLAGDLIPDASQESRLATAFNRLHRQTNEGGSVEEEFRAEYVSDRVNTLGTAILGLTLECARCHDHKYDPITQRNYYELSAFFANIDESGLYSHFTNYVPPPVLDLPSDAQRAELESATEAAAEAEKNYLRVLESRTAEAIAGAAEAPSAEVLLADQLAHYDFGAAAGAIDAANRTADGPVGRIDGAAASVPGVVGQGLGLDGENGFSTPVGGEWDWWQPFTISLWVRPAELHSRAVLWHRSQAWTDAASCGYELLIEEGRLSAALIHFWPGDAVRIRATETLPINTWSHVSVVSDGSGTAAGMRIVVDGVPAEVEVVRDKLVRTIRGGGADHLTIGSRFRDRGFRGGQVDEFRVFSRDLTLDELAMLAAPAAASQAGDASDPPRIAARVHSGDPLVLEARQQLFAARRRMAQARDAIPAIMTMREEPGLRESHILERGQYDHPGDLVTAAVPASLGPLPKHPATDADTPVAGVDTPVAGVARLRSPSAAPNRLDLARWLTDSRPGHRHPLVARVAVNRLWQSLFDQGLVATPEDFGLQGQSPSHPRLLDFLAATLIDEGWDMKRMVRRMVTSNAYRRTAICAPELKTLDPANRLLARGPSSRFPFETIRDAALAAGGLLDETFGGPPVRPYQPEGLWEEKSSASYVRQEGAESHRRSMYTYWKRTSPPPSMVIFDAPGREVCAAGRTITRTPLQALVLLNDDQFVEAARGVAFALLRAGSPAATENNGAPENAEAAEKAEATENARRLVLRLLGREATAAEVDVIVGLYQAQRQDFQTNPESASAYLQIGDVQFSKDDQGRPIPPAELAAWSATVQTLMNLDEWVTR